MRSIDLYELKLGDKFIEDTYPEVYKVVRIEKREDYKFDVIVALDLESAEEVDFYYDKVEGQAYAPSIIRISRGC